MTEMVQRISFSFRELSFKELLVGGLALVTVWVLWILVAAL